MEYPAKTNISYEEINNGALILLLLKEANTWEALCSRYADADPAQLVTNTNTFTLLRKLLDMRRQGLIAFDEAVTADGTKPAGPIKDTGLASTSDIKHFDYVHYDYDPEGVDELMHKLRAFLDTHFKSGPRNEAYDRIAGSFGEPRPNEAVARTIQCSGVVSGLQPGMTLWLAVETGGFVWPKESRVLPDQDNRWNVTIFEDGVTEKFAVSLFVADTSADRGIRDWLEAGRRTGAYNELRGIPGARRLARVDGLRLSDA